MATFHRNIMHLKVARKVSKNLLINVNNYIVIVITNEICRRKSIISFPLFSLFVDYNKRRINNEEASRYPII